MLQAETYSWIYISKVNVSCVRLMYSWLVVFTTERDELP